jgi:hypothetical protein
MLMFLLLGSSARASSQRASAECKANPNLFVCEHGKWDQPVPKTVHPVGLLKVLDLESAKRAKQQSEESQASQSNAAGALGPQAGDAAWHGSINDYRRLTAVAQKSYASGVWDGFALGTSARPDRAMWNRCTGGLTYERIWILFDIWIRAHAGRWGEPAAATLIETLAQFCGDAPAK